MRALRRYPVTTGYLGAVTTVAALSGLLGRDRRDRFARGASTDLAHLARRPLVVLPASAFVLERPLHGLLLPSLAVTMGYVERREGSVATAALFAAGHLGGTLVVAGGLLTGIRYGWVDPSWRESLDVGVSYGELALVAAAMPALPPRWRPVAVGAVTTALALVWAHRRQPVDAGHLAAWLVGLGAVSAAGPRARPGRWATPRPRC